MDIAVADAAIAPVPAASPVTVGRLDQLAVGARAQVVAVAGDTALRRRLLEMGLTPRSEVEVIRLAPLGDPIELRLRGYHLSLRADQARLVTVAV